MKGCGRGGGRGRGEGVFEWAFVWGDVDPHGGGLGACEPDGCTVVVEVRATVLFEGLGGGVEEAHHGPRHGET